MQETHVSVRIYHDGTTQGNFTIDVKRVQEDYKLPDDNVTVVQLSEILVVVHWEDDVPEDDAMRRYVHDKVLASLGYKAN